MLLKKKMLSDAQFKLFICHPRLGLDYPLKWRPPRYKGKKVELQKRCNLCAGCLAEKLNITCNICKYCTQKNRWKKACLLRKCNPSQQL